MVRLRRVARSEVEHPVVRYMYDRKFGDRDPTVDPGMAGGARGDFFTVLAQVPDVLEHVTRGFMVMQDPARLLDRGLCELIKARTGWSVESQFVYSGHCKTSRLAGVDEERIACIPHWQVADCYSAAERAALAFADCLAAAGGRVPDGIFTALSAHFSEQEIIELDFIVCTYAAHGTTARALQLDFDDRPDPITEVPVTDGQLPAVMPGPIVLPEV